MCGATENTAVASRPAAPSGGGQTATASSWARTGSCPPRGKTGVKENMTLQVLPTGIDVAEAAAFLTSKAGAHDHRPQILVAIAASSSPAQTGYRDVEQNHAKAARREERP